MQYLLGFIQQHSLEEHLYFVAPCPSGSLELVWRRSEDPTHWQLRSEGCEGPWQRVAADELIAHLALRGADMAAVKTELTAMLAAQIAFADLLLHDSNRRVSRDVVERFVLGQERFIRDLQAAVDRVSERSRPKLSVVHGDAEQTDARVGHLSLVR